MGNSVALHRSKPKMRKIWAAVAVACGISLLLGAVATAIYGSGISISSSSTGTSGASATQRKSGGHAQISKERRKRGLLGHRCLGCDRHRQRLERGQWI